MGIIAIIKWLLFKSYNVGAGIVIFGLITKIKGYGWSDIVVIIGLFVECIVFLMSAFFINEAEGDEEKENKVDENNNKFKKIYYMNENGHYYMENPNYIQATYEDPIGVVGVPYRKNLPLNYSSLSSEIESLSLEIERLSGRLKGLKAAQAEEVEKYIAENPDYNKNNGIKKNSGKIKKESKKVRISRKKK